MLKEINLSHMDFYSIIAYKIWVLIFLHEKGLIIGKGYFNRSLRLMVLRRGLGFRRSF